MRNAPRLGPVATQHVRTVVGHGLIAEREARARVAALAGVQHPGICVPLSVERDGAAVVVIAPLVEGPTLAEVCGDGIETLPHWVWLMHELAGAVAALHEAGVVHGDVSPANIVMGPHPVLVDLVGPALGEERGTPGFASPERGGRATAADDVYGVGAVGRAVGHAHHDAFVTAWTAPLVDPDQGLRPSARAVARGILRCGPVEPWQPSAPAQPGAAPRVRTVRERAGRVWRVRKAAPRIVAIVGAVSVATAGVWWAVPSLTAAAGGGVGAGGEAAARIDVVSSASQAASRSPAPRSDPARAARDLTIERAEAASRGDAEALLELVVPGSQAWADVQAFVTWEGDGASVNGASVEVTQTEVLEESSTTARVRVSVQTGEHTVREADGTIVPQGPRSEQVDLTLEWADGRWRVSLAMPVASATPSVTAAP